MIEIIKFFRKLWELSDPNPKQGKPDTYAQKLDEARIEYVLSSVHNMYHLHVKSEELKVLFLDYARQVIEETKGQDFKFGENTVGIRDGRFMIVKAVRGYPYEDEDVA